LARRIASARVQAYAETERSHGASMGPVRLTDAQLTAVFAAARPLAVASRDAFLLDLAVALQGQENLGDATVFRLIREVQRWSIRRFRPTTARSRTPETGWPRCGRAYPQKNLLLSPDLLRLQERNRQ
jgi:hypothetical protein